MTTVSVRDDIDVQDRILGTCRRPPLGERDSYFWWIHPRR